jgi:hypothetical protein
VKERVLEINNFCQWAKPFPPSHIYDEILSDEEIDIIYRYENEYLKQCHSTNH